MNILMVASDNSLSSGAFKSMVVLSKKLIDDGINVLVALPYKGDGISLLEDDNIPYIYIRSYSWIVHSNNSRIMRYMKPLLGLFLNINAYFKYKKIIKQYSIDIVHNNTSYTYIAALAALKTKVKLVWHLRKFLEEDQNNRIIFRRLGYRLINKSDRIICISNSIFKKYETVFDKNRLCVIYNGIDDTKYCLKDRKILTDDKVILLCIGRVFEKKGQFDLCEAIGILENKYNYNIELDLVGSCSCDSEYRINEIQKKYNIDCINICGRRKDTMSFYSKADIAFMCSSKEAFGRVTVEAMMAGCLVIGGNTGATTEIIRHNENGLLYETGNINDLADKIEYALNNKSKMIELANNGQKDALNYFNADINEKNVSKTYNELLER